jgi:hypothetical protein
MQAVNEATLQTLEQFKKKAHEVPFEEHPYSASKRALEQIGKTAWDDEHREAATAAMAVWVKTVVIGSVVLVLNEIVALMKVATETGEDEHRKAAEEMSSSMTFVENVMRNYVDAVDCRHIAEHMFAHGEQIEAEMAAAEAAKAKVKAFNAEKAPLQGKIHRIEPSVN